MIRKDKCTDCVHCGWGFSLSTQEYEHKVCLLKPKVLKHYPGEFYYAIGNDLRVCDKFKRKEDNDIKTERKNIINKIKADQP